MNHALALHMKLLYMISKILAKLINLTQKYIDSHTTGIEQGLKSEGVPINKYQRLVLWFVLSGSVCDSPHCTLFLCLFFSQRLSSIFLRVFLFCCNQTNICNILSTHSLFSLFLFLISFLHPPWNHCTQLKTEKLKISHCNLLRTRTRVWFLWFLFSPQN